MHFSTAFAVAAAVAPIVSAHDGPSMPKVAGLNIRDLKARAMFENMKPRHVEHSEKRTPAEKRQSGGTDGQCGQGLGTCAPGYCCSSGGWCGNTPDYCYSPGCLYAYGPGCPENQTPAGTNTSTVPRTQWGSVQYGGAGIYECVTPGTVAITYDDGPLQNYTAHILDIFQSYNAKATFFITGNNINKGEIDTTPELTAVIQRAYAAGHQIASHTWTHLDLSAISSADRHNQMYKNEMALRNILGFFPTYMRPPYSSCTSASGCETDLKNMGYHAIYFNVDTDDYEHDDPTLIQTSKNWFYGNITAGGATPANSEWLSISHDIHQQTAYNLTDYMLSTITKLGYKAVTVGECLGDPVSNWYRSGSGSPISSTVSPASSTSTGPASTSTAKVSTDATCGGTNGYTCLNSGFGNCCSVNGWCGSTTDYCGTGCQSKFGTCTGSSSSAPASVSSTRASSSAQGVSSTRSSSAPAATSTKKVSTDATCGGTNGYTCLNSGFGNCCSVNGWCGSTTDYCGAGCQSAFGTCTSSGASSTRASSAAAPTSTLKVSTDGTCSGTTKYTCNGSSFGNCCSQYGWCGSDTAHCGTGCQSGFGTCS